MKVVVLDIDNTLADYASAWLDFLYVKTGKIFAGVAQAKDCIDKFVYFNIKEEYRTCGQKRDLPMLDVSVPGQIAELKKAGWDIAIVSSRPAWIYPCIRRDTIIWLGENAIQYDSLYFAENKHLAIYRMFSEAEVCFVIEDECDSARGILELGFPVFLVGCHDMGLASRANCVFVGSAGEALAKIIQQSRKEVVS